MNPIIGNNRNPARAMCSAINGRITCRDAFHFVTITPSVIIANAISSRIVTNDRNIIAEALSEYRNHIRVGLIVFNLVWTLDDMMDGSMPARSVQPAMTVFKPFAFPCRARG
jgi:hypothetical protein